jgi:hypothetical protein
MNDKDTKRNARIVARWNHRLGDSPARLAAYPGGDAPGRFLAKTEVLTLRKLLSHSLADQPRSYRDAIPREDAQAIWDKAFGESESPINLTRTHALQGLSYLRGLAFTPRGTVRESAPFGYRERAVIESAWDAYQSDKAHALACMFHLVDFWDARTRRWPFYLPVYRLHGLTRGGCFDYIGRSWQVDTYNRNSIPFIIG